MAWQAPNWSVVHIVEALIGSNHNKTKPNQCGLEEQSRLIGSGTQQGVGASGLVIFPNMARYYKRYAYKGNQGSQATTMLFEVEQRECISEKQIDG